MASFRIVIGKKKPEVNEWGTRSLSIHGVRDIVHAAEEVSSNHGMVYLDEDEEIISITKDSIQV